MQGIAKFGTGWVRRVGRVLEYLDVPPLVDGLSFSRSPNKEVPFAQELSKVHLQKKVILKKNLD